ncbi:uncharacterized protein LOC111638724 [Centruroides sculpturatus]|uniref:uncharacterized protein LOC111638724 n=1 Tax=Centruroides sculpturatus TaxID=218467 RepID=UPI000C6CF463|nr:uncharacterized protein LOC111638724 [Centruroides sculpturatus]
MRLIPAIDLDDNVTINELPDISLCIQNFLACFDNLEKLHVGPILANMIMELYKEDVSKSPWKILSVPSRITLLMCANGFLNNMELLKSIPLNIILLEYGHQAEHDYQMPCKMISQVGISCCVCTGTSAWNSLAGCPEAAINNIYHAIQANSYQNLMGLIVADWGGSPHHTSLSFSLPGVVVGVGLAWNPSVHWDYINSRLTELINTHIILDAENVLAQLILELGRIETYLLRASRKQDDHDMSNLPEVQGSILHQLLDDTDNVNLENLSVDSFQKVIRHVKYCQRELQKSKAKCHQNGEIISEIQLATELMLFACRIGKLLISIGRNPNETMGLAVINVGLVNLPPTSRTDLANKLLALIEQYRAVWLSRNLPVGLHASLLLFNNILNKLIPEDVENSRESHFSIDTADVLDYNGSV